MSDNLKDSKEKLHNQRLMSLGILSGGVAHDFNNILTGMLGHLAFIKRKVKEDGELIDSIMAIENGISKASSLTKQILNFSRLKLNDEKKVLNLSKIFEDTVFLLRASIPPIYEIETWFDKNIFIEANEAHIAQILINLVVNAKDALGEKGKIIITLKSEKNNQCFFSVSDNGSGISDEIKDKILNPYFSTKGDNGTGLGLYTVSKIVAELNGTLSIDSKEGKGSQFTIFLPTINYAEKETNDSVCGEEVEIAKEHAKILFVDDEEAIREVFLQGLEYLGYKVFVAKGVNEAYSIFKKERGNFDVVVSDMLMPDGSGEDLFIDLMSIKSDVKFIVISGFSAQDSVRKMLDSGAKAFLTKPFSIESLNKTIQEVLENK